MEITGTGSRCCHDFCHTMGIMGNIVSVDILSAALNHFKSAKLLSAPADHLTQLCETSSLLPDTRVMGFSKSLAPCFDIWVRGGLVASPARFHFGNLDVCDIIFRYVLVPMAR